MKTPHGQGADARLDAMLASTNDRMLAAISRRIDLDGRLDEIIGKPPQPRYMSAAAVAAMASAHALLAKYKEQDQQAEDSSNGSGLKEQILQLIHGIDLLAKPVDGHFLLHKSIEHNLMQASAMLSELELGLDARALGATEARELMGTISSELGKAVAASAASRVVARPDRFCGQSSCKRKFIDQRIMFAKLCGTAAASIAVAVVVLFLLSWSRAAEETAILQGLLSGFLGVFAWRIWIRELTLKARARMHGWVPYSRREPSSISRLFAPRLPRYVVVWRKAVPANKSMRALFIDFLRVQKRVMELFDEADDHSPQCAPHR